MAIPQTAVRNRPHPLDQSAAEKVEAFGRDCGSVFGYRMHLRDATVPCGPCLDAAAVDELERSLANLTWPMERVKLSLLFANRPDLASLPLIGSRLAAGVAEGV